MKVLELGLTAFGPFTGRRLEMRDGEAGLQVVYGLNEAGKSAALRGLTALLYGIEMRTPDDFVHRYENLRLEGHLQLASGREIRFVRRKGSKATLLDPDGRPLPDDALEPFLGGVREDAFRRVWGIDHERLQQGGRELLEGKGDLAEALFSAGAGIARLSRFRKELEDEAAALFAATAQKPPVNQALSRLNHLRTELKRATLTTVDWERAEQAVKEAEERVERLDAEVRELRRRRSRVQRVLRTAPLIRELDLVHEALIEYADTPLLPEDFPGRRQAAQRQANDAKAQLAVVESQIEEQEHRLETLGPAGPILREAEVIKRLRTDLGSHQQAAKDRPDLVTQRNALEQRARQLLKEIRPDLQFEEAGGLRVFLGRQDRISRLVKDRATLDERLRGCVTREQELQDQDESLTRREAALPEPRDPAALRDVTERARERGDAEAELRRLGEELEAHLRQRDDAMRRLGLAEVLADRLSTLRLPGEGVIEEYVSRLQELTTEVRDARKETERLERSRAELLARISALGRERPVPSLSDLQDLRDRRDELLRQLRSHGAPADEVPAVSSENGAALWDRYEDLVRQADECADQLRVEAARVAQLEKLRADAEADSAGLEKLREADERRWRARERLDGEWTRLWEEASIAATEIPAARDWLRDFNNLCNTAEQVSKEARRRDELRGWISERLSELNEAMRAVDASFRPLPSLRQALKGADELIREIDAECRERIDVRKDRVRLIEEREKLARDEESRGRELQSWKEEWRTATRGLLPEESDQTDDVEHALKKLDAAFRALDESESFTARIEGIDARAVGFLDSVRVLAARLDGSVLNTEEECIRWLEWSDGRLDEEIKQASAREQCLKNIEAQREKADRLREKIALAEATLGQLREEAACGPDDDLEAFEKRCLEAAGLREEVRRLERDLKRTGDGLELGQLRVEVDAEELDGLEASLKDLEREIEQLDAPDGPRATAQQKLAEARAELESRRGATRAVELSQEYQETLSELRELAGQYARLKAAGALLARRIEIYRRENQAPLLRTASNLFRQMTRESFTSLEADLDETRPILVGIRGDGARVRTEGMSEGTRDQLYLALRLAAVESACKKMEPMPFVVDDILVQFDDERSTATLEVLSEVAKTTQVVLFTHHRHVRDAAARLGPEQGVFVQEL